MHQAILILCCLILIGSFLLQTDGDNLHILGVKWPVRCSLYSRFGVKCALCGMTRAFSAMAHRDIRAALHWHALGPAFFVFVCLQIPYRIYALAIRPAKTNAKLMKISLVIGVLLVVALFANWFVYLGGLIV